MEAVSEVLAALKRKGSSQRLKIYANHGAPIENMFGVSVADMKVIAKKIKGNQELAYELFESGNSDAMYLAGMVADGAQMTKKMLDSWAKKASWSMISEYAVPGVAAESKHARDLAMKWISAKKAQVACCGWNTYSGIVAIYDDEDLELEEILSLFTKIESEISSSAESVKYTMNGFVISVGSCVIPLNRQAKALAKRLGRVEVDFGDTSCKVPLASEYIAKVERTGRLGKKRKTIKC